MDFVDRIVEHDVWLTNRLLERAGELPAEALDRPIIEDWSQTSTKERQTLRSLLDEMVANKENWSASIAGKAAPDGRGQSLDEMKQRYDVAGKEFIRLVVAIRDKGEWDAGFVDALCEPPEGFT